MKPWMWGVLAAVVLVILVVVAWILYGLQATPSPTPDPAPIDVPEPAVDPAPVDVPEPIEDTVVDTEDTDGPPAPVATEPGAGPDTDVFVDPAPEHITEAEFNDLLDRYLDECGLGDWSEIQRDCDDLQCSWLLAAPPPEGAPPPTTSVTDCPVWAEAWGPIVEATSLRVTCDDGVELEVLSVSPSTLRMRAAAQEGAQLMADPDALQQTTCATWGQ